MVKIQQTAICGTPDLLLCIKGKFVAIELKAREQDKPTELQIYNLREIEKAGGLGIVVHPGNWDRCLEYLTKLSKKGLIYVDITLRPYAQSHIRYGVPKTHGRIKIGNEDKKKPVEGKAGNAGGKRASVKPVQGNGGKIRSKSRGRKT